MGEPGVTHRRDILEISGSPYYHGPTHGFHETEESRLHYLELPSLWTKVNRLCREEDGYKDPAGQWLAQVN